tara:strand:- start:734 stop:1267 length:534 start_codon:yes stop_codon:yes gene_type:complete
MKLIYLDLDGVCADFTKDVSKIFNLKDTPVNLPEKGAPWTYEGKNRDRLDTVMESYDFWTNLDAYSWSRSLVELCQRYGDTRFLSKARPNSGCMGGKIDWILKYFPEMQYKTILTTQDKWVCSSSNSILIDDDLRHKEEWIKSGGHYYHWQELKGCEDGDAIAKKRIIQLEKFLIQI